MIQRQISLGVHSYAVVHFPCLTKKFFKNRDFGSFRRYCVKFHSECIRTPSFIFLSYEKNLQKSRFLGLCRNARLNITRSTDSTPSFIFLVLRKNPSKIEILGLCRNARLNITRNTFVHRRSFSDRATKCVTHFTFNTNFNLCHSSGWRANLYKTRIV